MRIFLRLIALAISVAIVAAGCGDDGPEVTNEQLLESIAGEDLTPAEVERQLQVASTLCRTDLQVLELMWPTMSARQLRFQDFVFGTHCPQRSVDYALSTGRSLTAEAHAALAAEAEADPDSDPDPDPTTGGEAPPSPSTLVLPTTPTTRP